jgi:hypothetical protein
MRSALAQGNVSGIVIMGSIVTVNVIAAGAALLPRLQAASWEGQIAAVFHRSLLLTASDERLLHLHTGPRLVSPFSLRIDGTLARVLGDIPLVRGMPVRQMGPVIDIAEQLRLRLDEVTYYRSPKPSTGEIDPRALRMAQQTLTLCGRSGGFDRLPGMQTIIAAIQQAIAAGNPGQLREVARGLIGLGPGLTPSGDDFLVGCLRGLWLTSRDEASAREMLDCIGDGLLSDLSERTTQVGAEFLRYAFGGAFAEILDYAAEALVAPTHPQRVQRAITRLLAQGDTSGTDTTRGLLTCVDTLLSKPPHNRSRSLEHTLSMAVRSSATRG